MMHTFKKMLEDFNLEELMGEPEGHAASASDSHTQAAGCKLYRDGIAAAISGGNPKNVFGHAITHDEFSHLTPDEINTLYAEYTARIRRSMSKGISQLATKTYTSLIKKVFPVGDHIALQDELNNNPVLHHAFSINAGEAYHKFVLTLTVERNA